jgi:hypothetical protein
MIGQVTLKNGQKIVEPISGSIPTGNPVGTLLSRANGQVPRNYLECDGSTFNASQYPALYLYLGTNVLPERFDHTKLGGVESITVSTSSASPTTIEYDGFIFITTPYNVAFTIYINGTSFSSNVNAVPTYCYPVKKGDNVYVTASCTCRIRYYKSHLYIKAVDGVDISDEDTFLVTVKNFVDERVTRAESYSTEEVWTGGYWIDGKKIYRRVITVNVTTFGDSYITLANDTWVGNIDSIVNGGVCLNKIFYDNAGRYWKNNTTLSFNYGKTFNLGSSQPCNFVVEYTKTTD